MRQITRCSNTKLLSICQQAAEIQSLTKKIQLFLPSPLNDHCCVGSFQMGCLNVVVDDPVWATPLRFELPELRDKLRKEGGLYQLTSIKIRIDTHQKLSYPNTSPTMPPYSAKIKKILEEAAHACRSQAIKKLWLSLNSQ